jgi:hypothetical protein
VNVSGEYFVNRRSVYPSRLADDPQLAAKLWMISEELTGINKKNDKFKPNTASI